MAFLEISSLTKSFGTVSVLHDINLQIERGEFVVFVGPSGCGKSTLLRMITGLESASSGTIAIEDQIVNDVDPAKRGTAMVFQSYALYPHMTVAENMSFGLRMAHEPKALIAERVQKAAMILQLEKLLDRKPAQLSGGQKQRVAIGRAIVREPRLFLFDEPLSNLDAELRVQMRAELMELHRRLGTTMIYVTHDQVEAMTLADKMVVMNGGKVQQAGKPLSLYDDPANQFVAGFVGSPKMNFLSAQVSASENGSTRLERIGGDGSANLPTLLPSTTGTTVRVGLRPEHIKLTSADQSPSSASFSLQGRVAFVEELGSESYVHVELADKTRVVARAGRDVVAASENVRLVGDLSRALMFATHGERLRYVARSAV